MKHLEVAAALIIENGRAFCARRPHKGAVETAGKWEFPGGKIEGGETPPQALERELSEELGIKAAAGDFLATVRHQYQTFHLTLHLYRARIIEGSPQLREHTDSCWLAAGELHSVDWAPADLPLLPFVENLLKNPPDTV